MILIKIIILLSIELKAKSSISANLVLICWSLNQQICT